jgi:drug/metabolite transporter (DMT)-like permease
MTNPSSKQAVVVGIALSMAGVACTAAIMPMARYAVHFRGLHPLMFTGIWLLSATAWSILIGRTAPGEGPLDLRKQWRVLLTAGLLHLFVSAAMFTGIKYVSAPIFAFLYSMSIPAAALMGWIVLRETARLPLVLGLGAAMAGLAFLLAGGQELSGPWIGVVLALSSAVVSAGLDLLVKRTSPGFPIWAIIGARAFVPGICLFLWSWIIVGEEFPDLPLTVFLLGGALIGPALGYYLLFRSLRYLPLAVAATLRALAPILTTLYAAIALGEMISSLQVCGGALIVVGAALAPVGTTKPRAST